MKSAFFSLFFIIFFVFSGIAQKTKTINLLLVKRNVNFPGVPTINLDEYHFENPADSAYLVLTQNRNYDMGVSTSSPTWSLKSNIESGAYVIKVESKTVALRNIKKGKLDGVQCNFDFYEDLISIDIYQNDSLKRNFLIDKNGKLNSVSFAETSWKFITEADVVYQFGKTGDLEKIQYLFESSGIVIIDYYTQGIFSKEEVTRNYDNLKIEHSVPNPSGKINGDFSTKIADEQFIFSFKNGEIIGYEQLFANGSSKKKSSFTQKELFAEAKKAFAICKAWID